MAPGLAADVPLPYASWAEFDLLAPPRQPKDAALAPAAAFVSNCNAANWRLQALDALAAAGLAFDSYGRCRHNVGDADGSDKRGFAADAFPNPEPQSPKPTTLNPPAVESFIVNPEFVNVDPLTVNTETLDLVPALKHSAIPEPLSTWPPPWSPLVEPAERTNKQQLIASPPRARPTGLAAAAAAQGYVTEKFYHSLEAGTVPVVLGAPDILDFAPSNNSVIVYRSLNDTRAVVEAITRLSKDENNMSIVGHLIKLPVYEKEVCGRGMLWPVSLVRFILSPSLFPPSSGACFASTVSQDAYWRMLEWKRTGPSDSFKAIADISAVHSTCRLCILLATRIQEREKLQLAPKRPCRCRESWAKGILYHVRVREHMRFSFRDFFVYLEGLTLRSFCAKVTRTFGAYTYQPIWHNVRPGALKSQGPLKVFRIYPAHATQKAALFGNASFRTSSQLRHYLEITPCPRLEVIFV
eukprot:SM000048S16572  [mRNA]  locus=s48:572942:574862:+ [translate_table: standard]